MPEEITMELARPEIDPIEAPPLRVVPIFQVAAKTDIGKARENNEDKYEFFIPTEEPALAARGSVFVVCDGMGGHEAGQIASELACKTFLYQYYHGSGSPETAARQAVLEANSQIYRMGQTIPSRSGMGTTLTALILCQDKAVIAHVGDSRCYRLLDGAFEMLTEDHTIVHEWVKQGTITEEQAKTHPYRNALHQALGVQASVEPRIETYELTGAETFLLCSDGVNEHIEDTELAQTLTEYGPSEAAWKLIDRALANGGSDNATVLIARLTGLSS